eukprot:scaffold52712_cov30-Phaeocystis_antarctica.AAC.1
MYSLGYAARAREWNEARAREATSPPSVGVRPRMACRQKGSESGASQLSDQSTTPSPSSSSPSSSPSSSAALA